MTSTSVGWCEESFTESTTSVPAATGSIPLQAPHTAASGSIPLLLLLPPETAGGETTTFSHQPPQTGFTKRKHLNSRPPQSTSHSSSAPHNRDKGEDDDGDGEEGREESVRLRDDLSPPEVERFLLLRSSPVISRRHRPVSWHGGEASASRSSPGSLCLDQRGRPTLVRTEEDCPRSSSLQDNKQHRVSSNLNHFLTLLFHLPSSGQQGLAGEHRGRRPTSCEAPPTAGLSSKHRSSFPEFSADFFKMSCELEKENAHFVVVDLVLEALEAVKWTLRDERRTSTTDTHTQHDNRQRQTNTHRRTQENDNRQRQSNRRTKEDEHQPTCVVSTDAESEDGGGDVTLTLRSAEWLAQRLVLDFRRSWLPSHEPRGGRQSLRSSLQELPGTGSVAASGGSLTEEIRLRTRMRGSLSWAPPRLQIIFTVQPTLRRSDVVASQHFLCAGCGTEVEPRYMKKLKYCEYLGRYFCDCCHGGSEAVIPARVLSCWDFNRFPVSDFSRQLLDSFWFLPLFDLSCVCKKLCSRVRELHRFRELLDQLLGVRRLLKTCRLSERVMTEIDQLPSHLVLQQPPLLSMDDLLRLRKGQLVAQVKAVVHAAISHVEDCELCLARGFICEFCREGNVLFPFQSDACSRCPVCRTCFHKHCFVEKKCPKCSRIQSRKEDGSMRCES
ncbi:protein associated with UVRAG as autophagy enhancer [Hippoglossus stenolepis]|uniref:protein associated with UVRAG as autophagy enhancer n=1 Tax=Hippoglossus stenolepis TaxID=195615 RepID=UPI00159CA9EA|nr:protein associated with UVRAG as autophagy enhancer [Hippoglossus stenolepis]